MRERNNSENWFPSSATFTSGYNKCLALVVKRNPWTVFLRKTLEKWVHSFGNSAFRWRTPLSSLEPVCRLADQIALKPRKWRWHVTFNISDFVTKEMKIEGSRGARLSRENVSQTHRQDKKNKMKTLSFDLQVVTSNAQAGWSNQLQRRGKEDPRQYIGQRGLWQSNPTFRFEWHRYTGSHQCPAIVFLKIRIHSFSDAATIIVVNLYIRSFAKIDDVKMVSTLMQLFLIRVYGSTYVLCASSNSINAARNLKWAMQRDQPSVMRRGPLRNSLDI